MCIGDGAYSRDAMAGPLRHLRDDSGVVRPPRGLPRASPECAEAALVLGGGFFGFKFFKFTIETMLGLNDDMTMNF